MQYGLLRNSWEKSSNLDHEEELAELIDNSDLLERLTLVCTDMTSSRHIIHSIMPKSSSMIPYSVRLSK